MQQNEGVVENVVSRIRCGWVKWRELIGGLCREKCY